MTPYGNTIYARAMADKRFTVRDGEVFRGETHMTHEECELLLKAYRADANANDWWAEYAARRASELEAAMAQAQQEIAA